MHLAGQRSGRFPCAVPVCGSRAFPASRSGSPVRRAPVQRKKERRRRQLPRLVPHGAGRSAGRASDELEHRVGREENKDFKDIYMCLGSSPGRLLACLKMVCELDERILPVETEYTRCRCGNRIKRSGQARQRPTHGIANRATLSFVFSFRQESSRT